MTSLATKLQLSTEERAELVTQFGGQNENIETLTQKQAEELLMYLEDLAASDEQERQAVQAQG
jgi:hypothetical protein